MLRLLVCFPAVIIIFVSCKPEYKKCNCESKNEELTAYSEIVNEIVDHKSYNYYLGKDEERIFEDYVKNKNEADRIHKKVIRLQNKIFNGTSRFCTIYLDTTANRRFGSWTYFRKNDTSTFANRVKDIFRDFSNNPQQIFDSVGDIQKRYLPGDFTLCTSKMKLLIKGKPENEKCVIGIIRLSKIFFNSAKTKGLLYYEFVCGGLCGYGNLATIEKLNNRWTIISSTQIWVS